jgi:HSP20 family protein
VDIIDADTSIIIEAELPGLSKDDLTISVASGKVLTISGKNTNSKHSADIQNYILKELKRSSFRRSFSLGKNIDPDSIKADFKEGILRISINKINPTEPIIKTIKIGSDTSQ